MHWFRDLSIRYKLVVLGVLASAVALLAASASFLAYDRFTLRDSLVRKLESQAAIVASNSVTALMFADPQVAGETLGALRADAGVVRAALYDREGNLFARYKRDAGAPDLSPTPPAKTGHSFTEGRLSLAQPVLLDGDRWGTVWIESNPTELVQRRLRYTLILLPVLAGSILLAFLISSRLQREISRPLLELADTARLVSRDRDYSVRVPLQGTDETGELVRTFNEMLEQIQQRDIELSEARELLERRVEARTADLLAELAERRRAEAALMRSEALLADAQRLAHVGSWEWDLTTDRVSWSQEMYRIYGLDPATFRADFPGFLDRVHAEDRALVEREIQKAKDSRGTFTFEHRILRPDGVERTLLAYGNVVVGEGGQPLRMVGTGQDITERKRAEQERAARIRAETARAEAHAAQRRADLLADVGAELVSSLEIEPALPRVLQLIVPAFADGATIHLVADDEVRLAALVDRDPDVEREARRTELFSATGESGSSWVSRALAEGRPRVVDLRDEAEGARVFGDPQPLRAYRRIFDHALVSPLVSRGRSLGLLVLGIRSGGVRAWGPLDLSLAESLAGRIANAIDNVRLYREAQQANRMKDEFLATLSHELRTPLNAIVGWSQVLRGGGLDEATRARALETIDRNARAQAQLIEDILDVSRIVSGKLQLEFRPVQLTRIVEAAVDTVRPAAEAKGIRLEPVLPLATEFVSGDPDRLQQVVWNLLSNAIKFTPRGGSVEVRLGRRGGQVRIEVRDTGIGIPDELLDRIFERFSQVDPSSTRTHRGLGLGLAIVRHLVELHGGTVRAESPGREQGSTFVVELPLALDPRSDPIAEADAGVSALVAADRPLAGVTLVAVDDEEDARELIATILRPLGARVVLAPSAEEGVRSVERERPDVLLSDIEMPGEDGYSLIRRVRALPAEAGGRVPAAALTAYARAEDRARALAAGFQVHVSKPVTPAELAEVVFGLIGRGDKTRVPSV